MGESRESTENWIETWIEEQREKLRASQKSAGQSHDSAPDAGVDDTSSKRHEFLREMWRMFERFSSHGLPGIIPPLGWASEHERAWRDLAAAHAHYLKVETQLQGQLVGVQAQALASLERQVRERSQGNCPIGNVRELYDLWIECGEQSYAQLAHSQAYCRLQADVANAAVRLRSCQQAIIERALKQLDLPTRTELNSVHRQMRELRERLERVESVAAPATRNKAKARDRQSGERRNPRSKLRKTT